MYLVTTAKLRGLPELKIGQSTEGQGEMVLSLVGAFVVVTVICLLDLGRS